MIKTIFMFILSCLFIKCEPTPYFFSVDFHFISEDTSYTPADIAVEINSTKQDILIDSTEFTICPECYERFVYDTVPGYSSEVLMTNPYEFWENELPVIISVKILDSLNEISGSVNIDIYQSSPTSGHACLIYIAGTYDKKDSSIVDFYNAVTREGRDSLRFQSAPITGSSDSVFVVYLE